MSDATEMSSNTADNVASPFLYSYRLSADGLGEVLDAEAVTRWSPSDGNVWLHLDINDPQARRWLQQEARLPSVAVETLLAQETRPRTLHVDGGLLIVMRGVNTNPGEDPEDMVAVRVWIEPGRVISTRRRRLLSIIDIAAALDRGEGPSSPGGLLAMLADRLAARIGHFVDTIESRLDAIEDELGRDELDDIRSQLSASRRQLASVRRFLMPQRDALDRLNRQPLEFIDDEDANTLREEADRMTRYLEDLDLARERAVVLQEEMLSQMAQEQNSRMYVLSVVAAIFLPLTFITGMLGMNVGGLPGVNSNSGFLGSVLVMVVAAAGLLAYFRWKKWL